MLLKTIYESNIDDAIRQYRRLKTESPDAYDFAEQRLNELGLDLLAKDRIKDAIEILKLNVEAHPQAFNTYDSLGYAYMYDGRKDLAIFNYRKSIELNPDNLEGRRYCYVLERYQKKEYMIPMRDGVMLFTQVYSPTDASQKYPILFRRTPYGIPPYGENLYRPSLGPSWLFTEEGFIFASQDCRGQFKSEGDFIVMRPHLPNKQTAQDIDESSDTYDTIEWNVKTTMISAQSAPTSIGDHDSDGISDLMVKFGRQAVISALGATTGTISLKVTGILNNGLEFSGSDTIKVIN